MLCNYLNGDITFLPTQYCLSSRNFRFGCCKIFSSYHVAYSLGRSFHCTKYSLIVLLLNLLSLVFQIFSETSVSWPSSSKGGSISLNKISVTYAEKKYDVTSNKWSNFVNLSTTTYMQSLPKYLGKLVMKSIEIPLQQILELTSHLASLFSVIFVYIEWSN